MTDGDRDAGPLSEASELDLPQAGAVAVGSAAVSGDQQPAGVRVGLAADQVPPSADGGGGESCGVVIGTDRDEPFVGGEVVDAVGDRFADRGVWKVVNVNAFGLALGLLLLACVGFLPEEFLLLRIDADHWVPTPEELRHPLGEVTELGITIGMALTFQRLGGPLQ